MFRAVVVPTNGASWLATALLCEPWRIANELGAEPVVDWEFRSTDGEPSTTSSGHAIAVAGPCDAIATDVDLVVLVASEDVPAAAPSRLIEWIRGVARTKTMLAAVDAGADILARAGVLTGHTAAMHHEAVPAFREQYLGIDISLGRHVIDERRATCAGSATTLDFSLALLAHFADASVAARTAERLIHTPHTDPAAPIDQATTGLDDRLRVAMTLIANGPATRGAIAEAADAAGLSDRHLHRLFTETVGMSPRRFSTEARMRRARTLLRQTQLPVTTVAFACGYGTSSDFSRAFRRHFGLTPTESREAH